MKTDFKIILLQATLLIGLPLFAQQNNKAEAQTGVCQTKTDSASYEIFKKEAEKQINENQQKIALLKAKELSSSMRVNKKFNKKILALEIKNNKLRKRIGECVNIKPNLWSSFKNKFTQDMKKLGNALDDMAVDQYELSQ
jgi:hypothetical protein